MNGTDIDFDAPLVDSGTGYIIEKRYWLLGMVGEYSGLHMASSPIVLVDRPFRCKDARTRCVIRDDPATGSGCGFMFPVNGYKWPSQPAHPKKSSFWLSAVVVMQSAAHHPKAAGVEKIIASGLSNKVSRSLFHMGSISLKYIKSKST